MKKMTIAACILAFAAFTACRNDNTESSQTKNSTTTAPATVSTPAPATDEMDTTANTPANTIAGTSETGTTNEGKGVSLKEVHGKSFYGMAPGRMHMNTNTRIMSRPARRRMPANTLNNAKNLNTTNNVNNNLPLPDYIAPITREVPTVPIGVYNDQPGFGPSKAIGPRGLPNNMYTNDGRGGTYKGDTSEHMDGLNSVR